jgi:hypothetical protein
MRRTYALFALLLLAGFAAYGANNPIVGEWHCTSDDGSGQKLAWTLVVRQDGEKLSGSLIGGPDRTGEIPLVDPKLEGDTFTFKIEVNAGCAVEARLKIDGRKLEGPFGCAEASGTLKGTKQP